VADTSAFNSISQGGDDDDDDDLPFPREPFRRDHAWHYTGHIESRVLVDPAWLDLSDPFASFTELKQLISYARKVSVPTKIEVVYPAYLESSAGTGRIGSYFRKGEYREIGPPSDRSAGPNFEQALVAEKRAYDDLKGRLQAGATEGISPPYVDLKKAI
jgi:hypothetical protein